MKHTAKYMVAVLLMCSGFTYADREYMSESRDCCMSSCYECGCNPLYCGAWDLQIQGGVDPITWRNRDPMLGFECVDSVATAITIFTEMPKFNQLFKTPWTVGGQIGYHWSDNARVYVEFDYAQANGKSNVLTPAGTFTSINFYPNKYKLFEAYAGARYYWDRWCDRVSFFLGGKIGLTHHQKITTGTNFVSDPAIAFPDGYLLYRSNTLVSGGADFGFDICFCGNWSFVIAGAVIVSAGPSVSNPLILLTPEVAGLNLLALGGIGNELRFPVTAGIRYSF